MPDNCPTSMKNGLTGGPYHRTPAWEAINKTDGRHRILHARASHVMETVVDIHGYATHECRGRAGTHMRRTTFACSTPSSRDSRRAIPCPHAMRRESLNGGELRSAGTHGGGRVSGGRGGRGGAASGPGQLTDPPSCEPGACPWSGPGIQGGGMTLYTHWRRSLAHLRPATI
jgi:hypothetical protein